MKDKYIDLIEQSFDFPQDEFSVEDSELLFHDIPLMELIKQYGTPLKITYLPKISQQINRAKRMFNVAMAKVDYKGSYNYCYCTKSSHFSFVLEEAMKNDIHLETSSAYDIHIINALYDGGIIDKDRYIICNGFKRPQYVENIAQLVNDGFTNTIPVLDNKEELDLFEDAFTKKCKVGIRIACEEEPKFEFYTSRLGIRYNDIVEFYKAKLKNSKKFQLKMLHFFINTGIKDTAYYWNELSKCMNVYCELKTICPELDSLNIGGGFPIKNSLNFEYDYEYLTEEIVAQIKNICQRNGIEEPNIFTEFGSFTVGESGAALYSIVNQKQQNDRENWYMIDSSFITTLPDTWGINQRYIMLAINNWDKEYQRVLLGGLTCDSEDFYNSECHTNAIFLPKLEKGNPQYIGFFHTGAYQESLGGFGGIQHCLIPAPKHVIIDRDKSDNEYYTRLFAKEQSYRSMLRILGYRPPPQKRGRLLLADETIQSSPPCKEGFFSPEAYPNPRQAEACRRDSGPGLLFRRLRRGRNRRGVASPSVAAAPTVAAAAVAPASLRSVLPGGLLSGAVRCPGLRSRSRYGRRRCGGLRIPRRGRAAAPLVVAQPVPASPTVPAAVAALAAPAPAASPARKGLGIVGGAFAHDWRAVRPCGCPSR